MSKKRISMTYKLDFVQNGTSHIIKNIEIENQDEIAAAMFDAYLGTVDQIENTYEEALVEVRNIMEDGYGLFIQPASFVIEQNNEAASVILINLYNGKPLITEIFTKKKYYSQGMAKSLIRASMNALAELGYEELTLNVMPENIGARKLYEKLGFEEARGEV